MKNFAKFSFLVSLLLCLRNRVVGKEYPPSLQTSSHLWWGGRTPLFPKFLESPQNISALAHDSVFLPCNVEHLGDKTVTWMRKRDLHILTAGVFTFSADDRYKVFHPENTDEWTLQIKHVTPDDAGVYECQINSDPKISRKIYLKVKEFSQLDDPQILTDNNYKDSFVQIKDEIFRKMDEDKKEIKMNSKGGKRSGKGKRKNKRKKRKRGTSAEINGPSVLHIQEGSVLSLTCVVRHTSRRPLDYLQWYKEDNLLDFNSPRGGISVQTEKESSKTVSKLSVAFVTLQDSGQYSCRPKGGDPFIVSVHVQKGQKEAPLREKPINEGEQIYNIKNEVMIVTFCGFILLFHSINDLLIK